MRSKFKKLVVVMLVLLTIPTTWVLMKDSLVIHRYEQSLGTAGVFKASQTDGSTSARIGEILGVLDNLSGSWYSTLFGMGSGAWITSFYVNEYIKTDISGISGLGPANYRDNGNYIHHIHSGIFSILNRNGLIGLMFYSYFIYSLIKSSQRLLKLGKYRFRYFTRENCFVYFYGLGSATYLIGGIFSTIPSLGFYGNFDWGYQVALIPVAVKYISDSSHGIPYIFENKTDI